MVTAAPLRLGVVPYLNVAPMIHAFRDDPGVTLVRDVPSRLLRRLLAGEFAAGTIPAVDYAASDGLEIVPGVAIASRGAVRSVRLVYEKPLEEIRTVALDTSSHTSVALLRVLLRERLGREPEYVERAPDVPAMLSGADAALIIGDPALFAADGHPYLDLGAAWTESTGLPFVYAFWATPRGRLTAADVARLQGSLEAGLRAIPEIATYYNTDSPSPERRALCESYLRDNVVYRFGAEEQQGLREFYRRCHAAGLVPAAPELRFHGHP
jgi:chorismate dehydratase